MKIKVAWLDAMLLEGSADGHMVPMDAKSPIGRNQAMTPKELVGMGLAGCTAMDVIALLKKYKQLPRTFEVEVEITTSRAQQPAVFERADLVYHVKGEVDPEKLREAVMLSQTQFCGVSAMLSKSFPIYFRINLNETEIGSGQADFSNS